MRNEELLGGVWEKLCIQYMSGLGCELADVACHKLTIFGASVRCLIAVALTAAYLIR